MQTLQDDNANAHAAHAEAVAEAERVFTEDFRAAGQLVGAEADRAQLTAIAETATAEERRTKAVRAAGTALKRALATTPAAATVEREFAASLRQIDEQHKADESAILDRMHRDLEALGGGTS